MRRRSCRRSRQTKGFGEATVTFRLKDWGVSRQRYWGTPIPMIHCERDGIVPVPDEQLPVLLPEKIEITQQGGSPLARVPDFVNVTCPKCGGPRASAKPTRWIPSSIRAGTSTATPMRRMPARRSTRRRRSTGSRLTSTSAAWSTPFCTSSIRASGRKVMRDLGLITNDEPARRLFTQGMVIKDGAKMSKSKGNVVSPDDMVARYGADATRMYALFAAPPDRDLDWQEDGVAGVSRFLGASGGS